jgi:pimeloyl-ACP methyl ester carboxylesterase
MVPTTEPPCERGAQALIQLPKPQPLSSEPDTPWLRELDDAWRACAKTTWRFTTSRGGHDLRVAVHCLPPHDGPLLTFVHGILTDHTTWRYIAGPLASQYEVWLVDVPGCGQSDAPEPAALEPDG